MSAKSNHADGAQRLEAQAIQEANAAPGELVLARLLRAPQKLVYQAWTEPERLAQWWGPKGFKVNVAKLELRPGGTFLYSMQSPQGTMWGKFIFREVQPTERLAFVVSFCDSAGTITRHPMSPTWPQEVFNQLTLTEVGGDTLMLLRGTAINASDAEKQTYIAGFESMRAGFGGTFAQLEDYLRTAQ